MTVAFSREDLNTWARFSGDYNPIHFDSEVAKRDLGLEGVVVHGMLAMLALKNEACGGSCRGPWIEWKAMLKHPMPITSSYVLSTGARQNGTSTFCLSDAANGRKNIVGTCATVDLDLRTAPMQPRFDMHGSRLADRLLMFYQDFPQVDNFWVFLDALVFSVYMADHSATMFADDIRTQFGFETVESGHSSSQRSGGGTPPVMVMHTHHTVTTSLDFMRQGFPTTVPFLQYDVIKKEGVVAEDAIYGMIDIPVWLDGQEVMVVEMGLMAKKTQKLINHGVSA